MAETELVKITIDDKQIEVPKGMNLVEAAASTGTFIPHYCYHPDLSIAGNCRMCQIEIEGRPKLEIACNTMVQDGMVIRTHHTSKLVEDAQAATLEFILINHPLDCTVCDQSGHCKLQDYHYKYNAQPSRFEEDKVNKVKAQPLGPHVILDGERCIMCTRCIRFCDEVAETSELGMLNRGDKSVITVGEGQQLDNPLSGSVVDLCPVGALTHRDWRFNSRIWYTRETESICTGCSTGCNVKVAVRDNQVVQVKARYNEFVNKEWMCDEGRYGFHRFIPENRLLSPVLKGSQCSIEQALAEAKKLSAQNLYIFISPDLTLEEMTLVKKFIDSKFSEATPVVAYRKRELSELEAKLISPNFAANIMGAEAAGLVNGNAQQNYEDALAALRSGKAESVLFIGERSLFAEDRTDELLASVSKVGLSIGILADADSSLVRALSVVFPERVIAEKSGLMINQIKRLQYLDRLLDFPVGTESAWRILDRISAELGAKLTAAKNDRDFTLEFFASHENFQHTTIQDVKGQGIALDGSGETDSDKREVYSPFLTALGKY
ncbi:MAG: (2Fe-2S)-binding protein [Deltaproteobacteria bacterium]|nr:(2Fe-2S)-binding protein [Deltaproteobacteria bacterium]